MNKKRVLFVCLHNSARSQMAEAFLKKLGGDYFDVESAGFEPGKLNPLAVTVMKEIGIDISNNKTSSVFEKYKEGKLYSYVITVCDESSSERCPIFPGITIMLHWSFKDPSSIEGTELEKLEKVRIIRDEIHNKISLWVKEVI